MELLDYGEWIELDQVNDLIPLNNYDLIIEDLNLTPNQNGDLVFTIHLKTKLEIDIILNDSMTSFFFQDFVFTTLNRYFVFKENMLNKSLRKVLARAIKRYRNLVKGTAASGKSKGFADLETLLEGLCK